MRDVLFTAVLLLFVFTTSIAQVYVQLEKAGTFKTIRYAPGDILTFKLYHDDSGWHDRMIQSIDVPRNRIVFPDVVVPVDSIEMIRMDRKSSAAQIIGGALQVGGINLMLFVAYDAVFRDMPLDGTALAAGALNIVVGTVIRRIFRKKTFRVGPYRRIRLLDLNFQGPDNP